MIYRQFISSWQWPTRKLTGYFGHCTQLNIVSSSLLLFLLFSFFFNYCIPSNTKLFPVNSVQLLNLKLETYRFSFHIYGSQLSLFALTKTNKRKLNKIRLPFYRFSFHVPILTKKQKSTWKSRRSFYSYWQYSTKYIP